MMDDNQKCDSSNKEKEAAQNEVEEKKTEDSGVKIDDGKSIYPKLTSEDLKRPSLQQRKGVLQTKAEKPDKSKETTQNFSAGSVVSSKSYLSIWLPILIIVIIALIFIFNHWPKSSPNKHLDVGKLMGELKSGFDSQPNWTYIVIEKALKTALSEKSKSPGILVLISSRKSKEATNDLADRLGQLVSEPSNSVLIDPNFSSSSTRQLKKEIDLTIRSNLTSQEKTRAVLVRNLDQLPFEAAMIFHSFCDHENAPFKSALYVMTAFVEEIISPTSDPKQWDHLATKCLRAAWSDSGDDQVASLISRLTVSVAAVIPSKA